MTRIWTIGHSTHPLEEFTAIIKSAGIQRIADVRSVPRSRHDPQFNKDSLSATLPAAGVDYLHLTARGVEVFHIYPDGETKPHQMNAFAMVADGEITYPAQ
jgi:uncharacterized protein (DUF488 family)